MKRRISTRACIVNPRTHRTTWRVLPIGTADPLDQDQFDDYDTAKGVISDRSGSFAIVDAEGRYIEIRDRAGSYRSQAFPLPV